MMGHDDSQSFEEARNLHHATSKEAMESVGLDDDDVVIPPPRSSSPPFVEVLKSNDDGDGDFYDPLLSSSPKLQSRSSGQSPSSDADAFILEPPSYADAIFRSFDGTSDFTDLNFSPASPCSPSSNNFSDYLIISVSDPQKEQDLSASLVPGGTNYFTYLITTRTNFHEFNGTEFSVRRRFRDVVTLSERLGEAYRGFFIPMRPDKSVMEGQVMQTQEFVEQRRLALEKYLRKLAKHPVIRKSEEVRLFLEVQGKLPLAKTTDVASRMLDGAMKLPKQLFGGELVAAAVDVNEVSQPAKGGRDLLRIFKELKQYMANDWAGAKPLIVEEDKEFMDRKDELQDLEVQLSNVSQQAESLVKSQQDIGETMGQLGLAFVKLTKFETEQAAFDSQRARAADMKNVATASVKASRLYRELTAQIVKHLDKLHEYLGVMLAVNNALSDRSSALLTVQTLLSEMSTLSLRIEKLEAASSKIFGGDRARIRKIEDMKETLRVTEHGKNCAIGEYERIKENNKNELERLDKERKEDFVCMLKGFIVNQVGYAEKMAKVWETVAEETSKYANNKQDS